MTPPQDSRFDEDPSMKPEQADPCVSFAKARCSLAKMSGLAQKPARRLGESIWRGARSLTALSGSRSQRSRSVSRRSPVVSGQESNVGRSHLQEARLTEINGSGINAERRWIKGDLMVLTSVALGHPADLVTGLQVEAPRPSADQANLRGAVLSHIAQWCCS